jgi:hypothetical protein
MTGNRSKIWTGNEKSLVEVRRKSAKMLDFQRIRVSWGLSGRFTGRDGQKRRNRAPYYGIMMTMAYRSINYEVKWQIPV